MIAAIVPAYNEAPRIAPVLNVLSEYPFDEIIVVDDGSRDDCMGAVSAFQVRLIRHPTNRGKGSALASGVDATLADILFFCDADIAGLTPEMITQAVGPVQDGLADLFVMSRERARYSSLRFSLISTPLLDGQRVLTRALWERVPAEFKSRFEIEAALNFYGQRSPKGLMTRVFPEISQSRKEEKHGFLQGTLRRYAMYADVLRAHRRLHSLHA